MCDFIVEELTGGGAGLRNAADPESVRVSTRDQTETN